MYHAIMGKLRHPGLVFGWLYQCNNFSFIFYFRIPHNTLCLPPPPQILHKPLFSNALGNMQCPQEHLKTIVYAKFGGQTKCIMGNSKIDNCTIPTFCTLFGIN